MLLCLVAVLLLAANATKAAVVVALLAIVASIGRAIIPAGRA